ncbi:helix-turn-helix domain-containing protein [Photobacterium kagoshimensis]|uniref:helix-turn-helix domain-containing protein n=1 Tax=Photobacterium kagoshimensis TaxID=2910242 RepID=UPI003D0F0AEC
MTQMTVKQLREELGCTQQEMSQKLRMTLRNYQYLEGGKAPSTQTKALLDILNVICSDKGNKLHQIKTILMLPKR